MGENLLSSKGIFLGLIKHKCFSLNLSEVCVLQTGLFSHVESKRVDSLGEKVIEMKKKSQHSG